MTSPFESRPALRMALLLAFGILTGQVAQIPWVVAFWVLGCLFVSATAALLLRRPTASGLLLAACVAALGTLLYARQSQSWEARLLNPMTINDEVHLKGVVMDEPLRRRGSARFVVETESLRVRDREVGSGNRIMVRLRQADSVGFELGSGSVVRLSGLLDPVPRRRNPGERDARTFFRLHDIIGTVSARGTELSEGTPAGFGFNATVARFRHELGGILERYHTGEVRSYLKGIVLAQRSEMSDEQREAFLVSGTFHVIAVSGLHVGLITLMLHGVLGLLRLPPRALTVTTMAGVVFYMIAVGSSPSVVRASVMACVVLGARLAERRVDVYQSIGLAGSLVLLWDPLGLFDAGFQLSFAAVFGIVGVSPLWSGVLRAIPQTHLGWKLLHRGVQLVLVSLGAQIGTLPLAILWFERISVVSLAANLLIVPLSSLNVALGLATLALDGIGRALAAPYAALNDLSAQGVLWAARLASQVPGSSVSAAGWPVAAAIALPLALVALLSLHRPRVVKACLMALLVLANGWVWSECAGHSQPRLRVSVLDVGQGDALLVESPDGHRALVDGGPSGVDNDVGERVLVPYFHRRRISALDLVILTHPHSDHIGGIRAVLEELRVAMLVVSLDSAVTESARTLFETARRRGTRVVLAGRGSEFRLGQAVCFYVLHPLLKPARSRTLNNISIVCKLVYGRVSVLLAGDIERDIEAELVQRYGSFLKADVLKVAHHGSATSSSAEFLDAVDPDQAWISVGWRNRFFHPSPGTMRELARRRILTHRTDTEGALVSISDGITISPVSWQK